MKSIKIAIVTVLTTLILSSCNQDKTTYLVIETDFGVMKAELYDETPLHRDNIVKLAKEGFYDDLLFHRIIKGFMIQGGDPRSKDADPNARLGGGGPGYTIQHEIGMPHFRGTLAAARVGSGNPERNSSGSQFYIVDGKPVSDAALNSQESRFNFKYNEAQRAKYKEIGGAPMLDMDYTVFGELVSGLDVLDKIAAVEKNGSDRPLKDVSMKVRVAYK